MKGKYAAEWTLAGVLVFGSIVYFVTKAKKANSAIVQDIAVDETAPIPVTLNQNLVLQNGSRGAEVAELQRLLGINADGIFGSQTEAALKTAKGVTKITLAQWKTIPTVNNNYLPVGTVVMANIAPSTPTKTYKAVKKADGSFYLDNSVVDSVKYGQKVGKIVGYSSAKQWYLIDTGSLLGTARAFVKASEVKKI